MNQKVEQALIDYSNDVWDRAMKAGALAEQERIIKLLEEQRILCSDKECCWLATEYKCHCDDVIALIKEEK